MTQKTRKVLDICEGGIWLVCVKDCTGKANPYRLYAKDYDPVKGYRQKLLSKYSDFMSVLAAVRAIYTSLDVLAK